MARNKIVNGNVVPLTDTEEQLRDAEEAAWLALEETRLLDAIRQQREPLLVEADALVNRAQDAQDTVAENAARGYRQALRDITANVDPHNVTWPSKPQ